MIAAPKPRIAETIRDPTVPPTVRGRIPGRARCERRRHPDKAEGSDCAGASFEMSNGRALGLVGSMMSNLEYTIQYVR